MIIAITGLPGSGKTTIAQKLSEAYKIPWLSMGDFRSKMAMKRGVTVDELNRLDEPDEEIDSYQAGLNASKESFVIDGRLSWHFIPNSFKIFLDVDPTVAAQRVINAPRQGREDEKPYRSTKEAREAMEKRNAQDRERYQKKYHLDLLDFSQYDLIINTTNKTPEKIIEEIKEKIRNQQNP